MHCQAGVFLLLLSCNLLGLHFRNGGSPCGGSISTGLHGSDWTACDRTPQSEIGSIHADCLDSKGNLEANFQSSPVWSRLESMVWNSTFTFCEKLPKNTWAAQWGRILCEIESQNQTGTIISIRFLVTPRATKCLLIFSEIFPARGQMAKVHVKN